MPSLEDEMATVVKAYARHVGVLLRPLATAEEAASVMCPAHGTSCGIHRGCLVRQLEVLRADRLPVPMPSSTGPTGEAACA
jgi:hypothetical protein